MPIETLLVMLTAALQMRFSRLLAVLVLGLLWCKGGRLEAQVVTNPSFEGTAGAGQVPPGWSLCSGTPDIQVISGTGNGIYAINTPPTHGNTYMGMVTRQNGWTESMSQLLPSPLQAGTAYSGSIDIYTSNLHSNWVDRGRLEFWGGFSSCQYSQLLWSSGQINNFHFFQTYPVSFTPSASYTHFTILNVNITGSDLSYNCFDNLVLSPSYTPMSLSGNTNDATCAGITDGYIILTVTGGAPPYTFSWTGPGGFTSSSQNIYNLSTGTYSVTVTDALGNSATGSWFIDLGSPAVGPMDTCIWLGGYSNDWFHICNWSNDYLPDAGCHVRIPGSTPHQPWIVGDTGRCKSIEINVFSGAELTIDKANAGYLKEGP